MKLPYILRLVQGKSMEPTLHEGDIIIATKKFSLKKGSLIIAKIGDREVVKRIADVKDSKVYIIGDNPNYSTDSRSYGWLSKEQIIAKILWSKNAKKTAP